MLSIVRSAFALAVLASASCGFARTTSTVPTSIPLAFEENRGLAPLHNKHDLRHGVEAFFRHRPLPLAHSFLSPSSDGSHLYVANTAELTVQHTNLATNAVDNGSFLPLSGGTLAGAANSTAPSAGYNVLYAFGDSLTAGSEGLAVANYENFIATALTYTSYNFGEGGQKSGQIAARMNAAGANQIFASDFTLPASTGTFVTVTFPANYDAPYNFIHAPTSCTDGMPVPWVTSAGNGNSYMTGNGTFVGQDLGVSFKGSDNNTYIGCIYESGSSPLTYSMEIANPPGGTVTVAANTAYTAILPDMTNGCISIQAGRNNYTNASQVESDVRAMVTVASGFTECYDVMDILNGESEPSGSSGYTSITAINSWFGTTFGSHYVPDREAIVNGYAPDIPADVLDHNNDVAPMSLKAQDIRGSLTAPVVSTSTCAISFGQNIVAGDIVYIGSELIFISRGTDGAYTCTRGYGSTTAATYSYGTAYVGYDSLHPGNNTAFTPFNPNCDNGYLCMANAVLDYIATKPRVPVGWVFPVKDATTGGTNTLAQTDTLKVTGTAGDPHDGAPVPQVQILIDGTVRGNATLGTASPGLEATYNNPAYANGGWSFTYPAAGLSPGTHTLKAIATDSLGRSTTLGTETFTVAAASSGPPVGWVFPVKDAATGTTSTVAQPDNLKVTGTAGDPHDGTPVPQVQILIDGTVRGNATLGLASPGLKTTYNNPAYANGGWSFTYPAAGLSPGTHTLKAIATDSLGVSTTLGTETFTVTD